jgi:hypothetical protein
VGNDVLHRAVEAHLGGESEDPAGEDPLEHGVVEVAGDAFPILEQRHFLVGGAQLG